MSFEMDYDDDTRKIPYDDEPISRGRQSGKSRKQNQSSQKKRLGIVDVFQFLLCILLIVAVVMLYNQIDVVGNQRETYNINVDSETSNLAFASAKGMLSTVNIGAVKALKDSTPNDTSDDLPSVKIENSADFFQGCYSLGSGVIYSLDKSTGSAYIITNYHVIADALEYPNGFGFYYVLLWDSAVPIQASYIGGSYYYDIAVLYVTNSEEIKRSSCAQVVVANSSDIVVGEECVAIGNSMGRNLGVSNGCIRTEEIVFAKSYSKYVTYISHTASVNSGNSGGGLYNGNGDLIGIVNAKFLDVLEDKTLKYGEIVHGMFYAIPSKIALSVAENIVRNGALVMPAVGLNCGVSYIWNNTRNATTDKGLQTHHDLVMQTSTGDFKAGDKLLSVRYRYNGQEIIDELNHISSIENNIFNWSKGDKVTFTVERGGEQISLEITVSDTSKVK